MHLHWNCHTKQDVYYIKNELEKLYFSGALVQEEKDRNWSAHTDHF